MSSPETAEAVLGHVWHWSRLGTGHPEEHKAMYPPPTKPTSTPPYTHTQSLSAPAHSGVPTAVAHTQTSAAYLSFPAGSTTAPVLSLHLEGAPPNILPGCCVLSTHHPPTVHSSSPTTDRENEAEEEGMGGYHHPPETLGSDQQRDSSEKDLQKGENTVPS